MTSKYDVVSMMARGLEKVKQYEHFPLRTRAKYAIPIIDLHELSTSRVLRTISEKYLDPTEIHEGEMHEFAFLEELVHWFKESYFSWVDSPNCESCTAPCKFKATERVTFNEPKLPYSARPDGDYIIEREEHICTLSVCKRSNYFFRHTDAAILLNTRRGRCSEWAQVFTLMCRALGYRVRLVLDVTDHVWTEVYSNYRRKWVHIDSCEAAIDQPLMYERGWGKQLSYVVAVGVDDIQDVSWRYSANHAEMKSRRDHLIDARLLKAITKTRNDLLRNRTSAMQNVILHGVIAELAELWTPPSVYGEYGGRTSGDIKWVRSRNEQGTKDSHIQHGNVVKLIDYTGPARTGPFVISYSARDDVYRLSTHCSDHIRRDWFSLLFKFSNIERIVEPNWKMCYLARHGAHRIGLMEWHIDARPLWISVLEISAGVFIKDGCSVEWLIEDQDRKIVGNFRNADHIKLELLGPVNFLFIRITMSSGPNFPEIAWQHTQLFRTTMNRYHIPTNSDKQGFTFTLVKNKPSGSLAV